MTPAPSSALYRLNAGGIRVGLTLHALSGLNKEESMDEFEIT
jgi:hypothetical protein